MGTSARRGLPALLALCLWLTGCSAGQEPVADEERAGVTASTGQEQVVRCAGKGPAVVLVNGIGDSATSTQWVEVVRLLSPRARVCRYDRPGTGESDDPDRAGRGADRHADRLRGLVLIDGLDPSVGVVAGTGADSFDDVPMAAEALDLAEVEAAALTADAQAVAVPDAGHQIPSEDPRAVVDAVEEMLAPAG